MMFGSSVKETIVHVTDSTLLSMDSNRHRSNGLDRYRANWINISKSNNSNNNIHDSVGLSDVYLCHIFRCGSKRYQFQNKFVPFLNVFSNTTN